MAYTVVLKFESIEGDCPLSATKTALEWIAKSADKMIFEVEDEDTKQNYNVDLDDDSVTQNN
jgi:hypothetical protein